MPQHNQQRTSNKRDRRSRTLLLVIIGILLVINSVLVYNLVNKSKQITLTNQKLTEEEKINKDLEETLKARQAELESLKGKNAELDKMIETQQADIEQKAKRISELLKSGNLTKAALASARAEIASLKLIINRYSTQLDSMAIANKILREDLETEKSRNQQLTEKNKKANETIREAQRLTATPLTVKGILIRGSNKEVETSKAARIERIKVRFSLLENKIADLGPRDIYLKINAPDGSTLAIQETGSGTFEFEGQESLYTTKQTVEYDRAVKEVTMYWGKEGDWVKGRYVIEVYTEGYRIGSGELTLR